ncbi:MAG: phage BR0599 family protein, partial [Sphaerospermopsis kisseleviana]
HSVQAGDTLTAVAGCAKTIDACKSFNNIINYQGEPHIPGEDKFLAGFEG